MRKYDPQKYAPMLRLLASDDFTFLASQPGYKSSTGRKLRSQRRRILRQYLRSLSKDFAELHRRARRIVADAPEEQHELVGLLMRQRFAFLRSRAMIEVRLWLEWLHLGTVDVRPLVEAMERMQAEVPASPNATA